MPYVPFKALVPKLEAVTISVMLPTRANNWESTMFVTGSSSLKRGTLWSHSEQWADPLEVTGYTIQDAVSHVTMIALQDKPYTQEMFDYALRGGKLYEEPPLPF